jgi:hypothetical protein
MMLVSESRATIDLGCVPAGTATTVRTAAAGAWKRGVGVRCRSLGDPSASGIGRITVDGDDDAECRLAASVERERISG